MDLFKVTAWLVIGFLQGAIAGFILVVSTIISGVFPKNYDLAPLLYFGGIVSFGLLGIYINYLKLKKEEKDDEKRF